MADLKAFKHDIISGKIPRVCLFYGEEDYLKDSYLKTVEEKVVASGTEQFNKLVINEPSHIEDIRKACDTMPVFAEKRLVIVRNSGAFGKGGKKPGGIDELSDVIEGVPEHTCLVFFEKEIDGRLSASKSVKKNGVVIEFKYQRSSVLVKWVIATLKKMDREIDRNAAYMLIEYSTQGMYNIFNEMKKLVLYTEGAERGITQDDIKTVCTRSVKSRVFDLTDAIAKKDSGSAIRILDEMIMMKERVPGILYLVARQARQLIHVKKLIEDGTGKHEIAVSLKVPPFIAEKIIRQSEGFTGRELSETIKKCLEADYMIKSGQTAERTAAELLISDITI